MSFLPSLLHPAHLLLESFDVVHPLLVGVLYKGAELTFLTLFHVGLEGALPHTPLVVVLLIALVLPLRVLLVLLV